MFVEVAIYIINLACRSHLDFQPHKVDFSFFFFISITGLGTCEMKTVQAMTFRDIELQIQ